MPRQLGHDLSIGVVPGTNRELRLSAEERKNGLYIVGMPNMGKSRMIEHLIRQDIRQSLRSGCGLLFIDPLGSSYKNLIAWLARKDAGFSKVIPIDLTSKEWVVSYNMLRERNDGGDPSTVAEMYMRAMMYARQQASSDQTPQLERWMVNALLTLHCAGQSIQRAPELFQKPAVQRALLRYTPEGFSRSDWQWALDEKNRREYTERVQSSLGLTQRFVINRVIQLMTGLKGPSLDFGHAIEEGWIILVNASQEGGQVTEQVRATFSATLLTDVWLAAQNRGKPADGRNAKPFYVYVDEFQSALTPVLAKQLAQARGMGLNLTLAHQFPSQLKTTSDAGADIYNAIDGTIANHIVFRTQHSQDAEALATKLYGNTFDPEKIRNVITHRSVVGHKWIKVTDTSTAAYEQESDAAGDGESGGDSLSEQFQADPSGTMGTLPSNQTRSSQSHSSLSRSHVSARGSSATETTRSTMEPIYGDQIASIERVPVEDQLMAAANILSGQLQQHCVVRLMSMSAPEVIKAPHVPEMRASEDLVSMYTKMRCDEYEFIHRREDAEKLFMESQRAFQQLVGGAPMGSFEEEPPRKARRVKATVLPQAGVIQSKDADGHATSQR